MKQPACIATFASVSGQLHLYTEKALETVITKISLHDSNAKFEGFDILQWAAFAKKKSNIASSTCRELGRLKASRSTKHHEDVQAPPAQEGFKASPSLQVAVQPVVAHMGEDLDRLEKQVSEMQQHVHIAASAMKNELSECISCAFTRLLPAAINLPDLDVTVRGFDCLEQLAIGEVSSLSGGNGNLIDILVLDPLSPDALAAFRSEARQELLVHYGSNIQLEVDIRVDGAETANFDVLNG